MSEEEKEAKMQKGSMEEIGIRTWKKKKYVVVMLSLIKENFMLLNKKCII